MTEGIVVLCKFNGVIVACCVHDDTILSEHQGMLSTAVSGQSDSTILNGEIA